VKPGRGLFTNSSDKVECVKHINWGPCENIWRKLIAFRLYPRMFFCVAQQPNLGLGRLILRFIELTQTHTTGKTQNTDIHTLSAIRTRNPNSQEAADLHLWPYDRQNQLFLWRNNRYWARSSSLSMFLHDTPRHTHIHTHKRLLELLWASDRPDAETCAWQHTALTRERSIRTHNPNKLAVSDPCLIPRGHRDRLGLYLMLNILRTLQ
jgi:hypothetical protein